MKLMPPTPTPSRCDPMNNIPNATDQTRRRENRSPKSPSRVWMKLKAETLSNNAEGSVVSWRRKFTPAGFVVAGAPGEWVAVDSTPLGWRAIEATQEMQLRRCTVYPGHSLAEGSFVPWLVQSSSSVSRRATSNAKSE